MLDPDISTAGALRHLHRPEAGDPTTLDRRRFLQMVGMGLGAGLVAGPGSSLLDAALGHDPSTWALGPIGADEGVLVVIGMYGGNDGLNTVVPHGDGTYHDQHGALALGAGETLPLDGTTGLHPELTELKRFWDAGNLAIVEGVGHGLDDFSHFNSMAKWMTGVTAGFGGSGWIGRWLDGYLAGSKDLFAAAEVGQALPLHMIGRAAVATTVPTTTPEFGVPREWRREADRALFDTVRTIASAGGSSWLGRVGQAQIDQLDVAAALAPELPGDGDARPASEIARKLDVAARLINANLGFRVVTAGFGDFDSHAGQPDQHPARMRELNDAIRSFFSALSPGWEDRVTVMTFSEFGRTSHANDGRGTDHGSSAPQFVLGSAVRGGFHGQRPSLAGLRRWERMPTHVGLADYYGSVLDGWMGGGASDVVGSFTDLGLFAAAPSSDPTFPTSVVGDFVGIAPERIYDSRTGLGGRATRIGPGETVRVRVAGAGSIPATGVTAVSVNITSIRPGGETWIAAFPSGTARPNSSALNPRAGAVVPNMSVVGVGADGTISLYNDRSDVHVTVDAMGYFATTTASRMVPLSPARILDTRIGVGAPARRARGGEPLSLEVLGRGGVPVSGVDTVVLNVTSVRPTTDGWLTVWPTGSGARPLVANLSLRAGENVPNLVMCKVGSGGRIDLEVSSGRVDLVADVVGCFASGGSRLSPVAPARLLDTRSGNGAPAARVGAGREVVLQVAGRGGVPSSASAVALNVSAVRPSRGTFLTIYPDGEPRPTASSLNPDPGQVSANLVIAKLGDGGRVRVYNHLGDVHLLADVTAAFL
ncbi:DUF1501 domain-containing protein [Ilumatobacter sp.]|uniref:DUF1501 domain-containing protein n=1 Tax=Ilumatobacter sp. TaxID=1967498 RepID=UPI003B51831B